MAGNPKKPTHPDNPVGQTRRIKRARGAWTKHIRPIRKWLIEELEGIETREIEANIANVFTCHANGLEPPQVYANKRLTLNTYEYQIDVETLRRIVEELRQRMRRPVPRRELRKQVRESYRNGTADQVDNLARITEGKYTREVTEVLRSDPWKRRIALIESRVFEQMRGFQGETGDELARVLSEGVENGRNPRDVAKDLRKRFDVSKSRADRITRTEITQSYRRARMDEDEQAQQELGIRTRLLWFSALLPTTRPDHASRHGQTYTQEEVRNFYSRDANSINCRCNQSSVLVDEDGNPVNKGFVDEVREKEKRDE